MTSSCHRQRRLLKGPLGRLQAPTLRIFAPDDGTVSHASRNATPDFEEHAFACPRTMAGLLSDAKMSGGRVLLTSHATASVS